MNPQTHRLIFNKSRGCMMAVGENARSNAGCGCSGARRGKRQQSAIRAGDGGFQVNVAGKTDLVGGQITSTQAAIDNNQNRYDAQGGTSTRDLQNSASFEAQSVSVSVGTSGGKVAPGGVGFGSDKGSASSVTTAGISGVAGNAAARTGDKETGIGQIFDAAKVKQELDAQVKITQEFNKQAGKAIEGYVTTQRKALQEQIKNGTPEQKAQAEQAIEDVNMQERALNILVAGLTGMAGSVVTKEALSTVAQKMRDLMIEDSKTFKGVVDSTGKVLTNVSGPSEGVRGDDVKVGGTRVDLDLLCGVSNERCATNSDGSLALNQNKEIQFIARDEAGNRLTIEQFLKTPEGKEMAGATGGVQGVAGTLFGVPYAPGSWQDKLIESFAGSHDFIGGKLTGLYDEQGNATRRRDETTKNFQNAWSASGAIVLSAPLAAAEGTSPEVWKAIGILLGAGK
jgi:filamentous hemagglutinin